MIDLDTDKMAKRGANILLEKAAPYVEYYSLVKDAPPPVITLSEQQWDFIILAVDSSIRNESLSYMGVPLRRGEMR